MFLLFCFFGLSLSVVTTVTPCIGTAVQCICKSNCAGDPKYTICYNRCLAAHAKKKSLSRQEILDAANGFVQSHAQSSAPVNYTARLFTNLERVHNETPNGSPKKAKILSTINALRTYAVNNPVEFNKMLENHNRKNFQNEERGRGLNSNNGASPSYIEMLKSDPNMKQMMHDKMMGHVNKRKMYQK
jgi:hypothetical protein